MMMCVHGNGAVGPAPLPNSNPNHPYSHVLQSLNTSEYTATRLVMQGPRRCKTQNIYRST
jgi:hypothetical protein